MHGLNKDAYFYIKLARCVEITRRCLYLMTDSLGSLALNMSSKVVSFLLIWFKLSVGWISGHWTAGHGAGFSTMCTSGGGHLSWTGQILCGQTTVGHSSITVLFVFSSRCSMNEEKGSLTLWNWKSESYKRAIWKREDYFCYKIRRWCLSTELLVIHHVVAESWRFCWIKGLKKKNKWLCKNDLIFS